MCLQRTCGFQVLAYYALLQELLLGSKCLHPHAGFHTYPVYVLDVSDVLLKELNLQFGRRQMSFQCRILLANE